MLTGGVQFKANLPLQFVFGPHLTSLPVAYSNVQVEILRLCGLGYYNLHLVLPFAPMRAMPQGSTPRKLEPGRDTVGAPQMEGFRAALSKTARASWRAT